MMATGKQLSVRIRGQGKMKRMSRFLGLLLLAVATAWGAFAADGRHGAGGRHGTDGRHGVERLSRRGASGRVAVRAGGRHLPGNAEVTFRRTREERAKRRIAEGWERRMRPHQSGSTDGGKAVGGRFIKAALPRQARGKATPPKVLAMYDVSISDGGTKWQPATGEPVRVDVELDEPVAVTEASSLGVVHLSDDGEVEELDSSRYGFTYNKDKSAVTAFWFSAEGFSVYAITEGANHNTDSTPARRLYDFYSLDFDTTSDTYNTYVPRYFKTVEGNYTFRQIVTNNQYLVRPEALPSPLGRTFMGWYLYSTNNANKTVDGIEYDSAGYATTPFDFDDPVVFRDGETGEGEYVLRSQFDHVGYVIFHEQPIGGDWPITAVRRSIMSEEVAGSVTNMRATAEISDLNVTYDDSQEENSAHENTAPRMIFRGWSEAKVMPGASTDVTGGVIRILSSPYTFTRRKDTLATPRHLFPVFVNINWLYFQAAAAGQGASYIPSRYYYADEGTNRFPVPARTGYTFNGWWTGTNTGVRVSNNDGTLDTSANLSGWDGYIKNGNLMLTANTTLYGRWEAAPTKYTVVMWQQKSTDAANLAEADKTYDFVASYTNYAMSATSVSVPATYKGWGGQKKSADEDYTGFHFDRCDGETVINGDGTTILNVYYDRDVYTMAFFSTDSTVRIYYSGNNYASLGSRVTSTSTINTLEGLGSSSKKTISGYQVAKSGSSYYIRIGTSWYAISGNRASNVYSASSIEMPELVHYVTALAGSSVKDVFPIEGYDGKTWKGDTYYTQRLASFELMPDTDIKFTPGESQNKSGVLYYWVEVDSSYEGEKTTHDGKYYTLYKTINHDYNFLTKNEDFHDLAGYVQSSTDATWNSNGQTSSLSNNNVHNFYYDRVGYKIEFKDSYTQNVLKDVGVKYSEGIAGHVPANPESTRSGYSFTGWYTDDACSTRVFFKDDASYRNYTKNKVLIEQMPTHNLQIYAGWEAVWYLITIDPNGGELAPGDSLWFWKNYGYTEIHEYTTATRSFEENVNGTYFYALPDRSYYGLGDQWEDREDANIDPEFAALISNRRALYTTDQSAPGIRDVNKRYAKVQNAYRYAGWYEVKSDGSEELYAFGSPVQHNLHLRLHWKHLGTYRLHYDPGLGEMVERDENEETFKLLDNGVYADSSELLITRTAAPPDGYAFAGWRIRYGDGTVYHPGQSFVFNAAYAVNVPGPDGRPVKQLILDAVYTQVRTVSLTTDANGGTIDPTVAVTLPLAYPHAPELITNITDTARTVSGMRNNAYGKLSDGKGYSCVVKDADGNDVELDFLGWNTAADGTGTHFAPGQFVGVDTVDALNGHNVLYAEWAVPVYFDKNNEDVEWPHDVWQAKWGDKYVFDESRNQYVQITTLNGYATYPNIVRDSSTENKMFAFWSTERYKDDSLLTPFDFENTPITGPTTLYAIWTDFIEVPFHPVDASGVTPVVREDWYREVSAGVTNRVIRVGNETNVIFDDDHADFVTPTGCIYAYVCLADSVAHISEKTRISRLYYNLSALTTYVEYPDGTTAPIPSGMEIYFVYFTGERQVDIGYRVMGTTFESKAPASPGPTSVTVGTDATNMADIVVAPNAYVPGHDHYAFAIGETNATSASQLRIITPAKEMDNDRPQLQVRNTWRGFEYSIDGGTTWGYYGHNAQLYVLYFDSVPTIINLTERTVGTEDDMTNRFEYVIAITQVVTTVTNKQTRFIETSNTSRQYGYWGNKNDYPEHYTYGGNTYYFGANGENWGSWSSTTRLSHDVTSQISIVTNMLLNGATESVTLFTDIIDPGNNTWSDGGYEADTRTESGWFGSTTTYLQLTQTRLRIVTTNIQYLVITQRPVEGFATSNDTGDGEYVYRQTAAAANATYGVTYTNTRESLPVELHVAFAQSGAIDHVDNAWRTEVAGDYTLTVPLSEEGAFEDALEKTNVILKAQAADRRFFGAYYGKAVESDLADENKVALKGPVTSIGFVKKPDADWYRLCLNGDASLELGDYGIYYVYGEIPSIRYVKEGANGALTELAKIEYVGNPVKMNGAAAAQGEALDVPVDGTPVTVAAGGSTGFRVPLSLDGVATASLNYYALAAGPASATATNAMDAVTWGSSLQMKVAENGLLKWSVDGATWGDFSGASASIFVIYKEKGYDLTISVEALASAADRAADVFTLLVSSSNLVAGTEYVVSGYAPGGTPIGSMAATACDDGAMLTFTVTGGSRIAIQSLPNNDWPRADGFGTEPRVYTLRELLPEGYALTNILINGAAPLSQVQVENGSVTYMDMDKVVELTNIKRYEVTFKDEDGTELEAAPYWYGTKAADIDAPDDPAKPMDSVYIYRFTDWTPSVADVESDAVYRAEYRQIKVPVATQRASATNLVVSLSAEEAQAREEALVQALKDVGIDMEAPGYSEEAATEELNRLDPNGLRHWENLVTGTSTNHMLLSTVTMTNNTESTISLVQDEDPQAPIAKALGYEVLYDLKRLYNVNDSANRAWGRVAGPGETPSFTVQLIDSDGKSLGAAGYYRVCTLIIPQQNLAITNELPSTNTIGVLEVNSPLKNTMTAVPWKALASVPEAAQPVVVQNYVDVGQLENGDVINALDEEGTYQQWTLVDGKWQKAAATAREVNGMMKTIITPKAENRTLDRGGATWVSRNGTDKPYFLIGQYSGEPVEITVEGGTTANPGCTMIANPCLTAIGVNDLGWGGNPGADDVIEIPSESNRPVRLLWRSGKWGYNDATRIVFDPVTRRPTVPWITDVKIQPGVGFWYYRREAAPFTLTIEVDNLDD